MASEPDSPSSVAERMISALLAGGEHVDDGRFCFDAEAAARVADYQLAEPRLWVVLLVEVAVLLGAAGIRFRFSGWVVDVTIEHEAGVDPALIDALERHAAGMGAAQQLGVAYRAALRTGVDRLSVNAIAGDGLGGGWRGRARAARSTRAVTGRPVCASRCALPRL